MIEDTSLEFDMFEDVRRRLVDHYMGEGRPRLEAEKIALYLIQGMRDIPKLIAIIAEADSRAHAEVNKAIDAVLENAPAFERARAILLGLEPMSEEKK